MAPISLSTLTNPLITSTQLLAFRSASTDGTPSINFTQSLLLNNAGILLRLPQDTISTALVLLQRYQTSATPSSKFTAKTISSSIIYLTAKLSFTPLSPRSVINVYAYLISSASPLWFINSPSAGAPSTDHDPTTYYVSEGTYERERIKLFAAETHILAALGYDTHVVLPHTMALTCMQTLGVSRRTLAERVFEHLNGGLLSPQLVYLTHQPNALAVAAIYLAAREVGVKLVEENWWEVFDVDREDLGFLVLAFGSLRNFAEAEREKVDRTNEIIPLDG